MKLTYICEYTSEENQFGAIDSRGYENTYPKVTMEFEAITIETMCRQFRDFLLGCGFAIDGEIGLIETNQSTDIATPSTDIKKLKEEE